MSLTLNLRASMTFGKKYILLNLDKSVQLRHQNAVVDVCFNSTLLHIGHRYSNAGEQILLKEMKAMTICQIRKFEFVKQLTHFAFYPGSNSDRGGYEFNPIGTTIIPIRKEMPEKGRYGHFQVLRRTLIKSRPFPCS